MYSNLRSLIFKLDPEKAHTLAIQSLKFNLVSNVFDENKNDPIFKTQIFGKDLSNPIGICLLYTSPSPRDKHRSRMPSSA